MQNRTLCRRLVFLAMQYTVINCAGVIHLKLCLDNSAEAVGFFRSKKILSTPFFAREVKPFVPCRIFAAPESVCAWKSQLSVENYRPFLAQVVPSFTTRVCGGDTWRCK